MKASARERIIERIEQLDGLDSVSEPLQRSVRAALPQESGLKDVLSGTWLGHPLHPLLTDVVVGAWTSALLLDLAAASPARSPRIGWSPQACARRFQPRQPGYPTGPSSVERAAALGRFTPQATLRRSCCRRSRGLRAGAAIGGSALPSPPRVTGAPRSQPGTVDTCRSARAWG